MGYWDDLAEAKAKQALVGGPSSRRLGDPKVKATVVELRAEGVRGLTALVRSRQRSVFRSGVAACVAVPVVGVWLMLEVQRFDVFAMIATAITILGCFFVLQTVVATMRIGSATKLWRTRIVDAAARDGKAEKVERRPEEE